MLSQTNSSISLINDESGQIDFSPISENKVISESQWFNYIPKKINPCLSGPIYGKKSSRSTECPSKRWGHSSVVYNKSMIIFGGRHSHRSLANVYTFDFSNLTWTKLEPLGQTPPARDSHSAILVILNKKLKIF